MISNLLYDKLLTIDGCIGGERSTHSARLQVSNKSIRLYFDEHIRIVSMDLIKEFNILSYKENDKKMGEINICGEFFTCEWEQMEQLIGVIA